MIANTLEQNDLIKIAGDNKIKAMKMTTGRRVKLPQALMIVDFVVKDELGTMVQMRDAYDVSYCVFQDNNDDPANFGAVLWNRN